MPAQATIFEKTIITYPKKWNYGYYFNGIKWISIL